MATIVISLGEKKKKESVVIFRFDQKVCFLVSSYSYHALASTKQLHKTSLSFASRWFRLLLKLFKMSRAPFQTSF